LKAGNSKKIRLATGGILLIARPGEVRGVRVMHELYRPGEAPGADGQPCLQLIAFDLVHERPEAVRE